jgi:hypothetical protein
VIHKKTPRTAAAQFESHHQGGLLNGMLLLMPTVRFKVKERSYAYGPLYTVCRELQGGASAEAGGLRDIWFPVGTMNLLHVAEQGFPAT